MMRPLTQCTAVRVLPRVTRARSHEACRAFSRHTTPRHASASVPAVPSHQLSSKTMSPARLPGSSRTHSGCACHGSSRQEAGSPRTVTAYVALGSNLGDRVAEIEKACRLMEARGIRVRRTSSLWETDPMYVEDQGRFLNGACEVETELPPLALLDALQAIEREMGREKVRDKGPRNIDLDILLYGDETFKDDGGRLNIPHIGIPEREFVLRPLAELIPSRPLDPAKPWRLVQDYLNDLPPSSPALSSTTPLSRSSPALTPLFPARSTHVMAILNVTPDSFSDGGLHSSQGGDGAEHLADTIRRLARSGATMIDVGGQSTAPGAEQVTAEEEAARVLPAIDLIRSLPEAAHLVISVDTYRASVAEQAVRRGAHVINDVSGGLLDDDMLPTAARLGSTVCLMHMRGTPATMSRLTSYPDGGVVPGVARELLERIAAAEAAGIRRWRIVLDPGIGFAKTQSQNLELLRRLDDLRCWPGLESLPWLVGASRKRFIGTITGVSEPRLRTWGTAATVAAAVQGGADIVRVHDVSEMGQVAKMADAIWRA